jgi:hypothetical protein
MRLFECLREPKNYPPDFEENQWHTILGRVHIHKPGSNSDITGFVKIQHHQKNFKMLIVKLEI